MKIAILGTGYVGLSTGVCLSEMGHQVICIDVDKDKIKMLQKGVSPIYEPGLESLLTANINSGRLWFTSSHKEGLKNAEVIIIAVGTPQKDDGSANLSYLEQAADDIAIYLQHDTVVVIKSTVPVGTNDYINTLLEEKCGFPVQMVSNPEFLRQGSAIRDTMKADRIIIGANNQPAAEKIQEMYRGLHVPIVVTTIKSAEMIKYASNAFLATKISFINEISNLCEAVGGNVEDVAKGMGLDKRIGKAFLQAGIGYGGSCFPKDVKALIHTSATNGIHFNLLKETISINETQRELLVSKALKRFGTIGGLKIALLGLSFKPETDDMREAASIPIARSLVNQGAEVIAYDPVAMDNAKRILGDSIQYAESVEKAICGADALFIITEWEEFKQLDLPSIVKQMKRPIIFDGRNCYSEDLIQACDKVEYYPIGKPSILK